MMLNPFLLSFLLLYLNCLFKFVMIDRIECFSIVKTGVFCNLNLFNESGVYLFSKHFAMVFIQCIVNSIKFIIFSHFCFGRIYINSTSNKVLIALKI